MSNAISALNGESYKGYVTVAEAGLRGMITLRADLGDAKVKAAVKKATGVAVPDQRGILAKGETAVAWMSPDELLIMVDYAQAGATVAAMTKALGAIHHLCVDVSDARATFRLTGAGAREVLAKLAPADLSVMTAGQMRRTRLAQVAAAFWIVDDNTIDLVTFRSTARYVFDLLSNAAAPGSEVDYL